MPPEFIIDQILPVGVTLIHAKPKARMSWLTLDLAWAVANGSKALGEFQALSGDVLYIDTVSGAQRTHARLHELSPETEPPKGLSFAFTWPHAGAGFEGRIRDYLTAHRFVRLVVVDALMPLLPPGAGPDGMYTFGAILARLSRAYEVAIVLTHTSHKDSGLAVTGLPAAADTVGDLQRRVGDTGRLRLIDHHSRADLAVHLELTPAGFWRVSGGWRK